MFVKVIVSTAAFGGQFQKNPGRRSCSGDSGLHCLNEVFLATGETKVEVFAAARCADASVQIRHQTPVNVELVFLHQKFSCHPPIAGITQGTEFMKGGIEFKTTPDKTR